MASQNPSPTRPAPTRPSPIRPAPAATPEATSATASPWALLRRAAGYLRPHRRGVVFILAVTLGIAALNAFEPLVLRHVLDGLDVASGDRALLYGLGGLMVLGLLREVGVAISNWLTWRTRLRVQFALLDATVSRLHRLPLSFHRAEGVGAVMTRLDRGIQGFVSALSEIAFSVVPAVVYLVLSAIVMLKLDWRLALVVLAFAPLPGIIAAIAAPHQTRREQALLGRWVAIYSRFNEVLSGILTVKSFAMEEAEKQRFLHAVRDANTIVSNGVATDSGVGAAQNLVVVLARLGAIGFGGWLALRGEATVGTIVAFLGYVGGLFGPVQGLSSVYRTLRVASVSLREIFGILDTHDQLGDAPDACDAGDVRGEVTFENVRFGYDPKTPVLDGVDLHVRSGETIALVGPSGAGKTTMMGLLQRFYDPDAGRVLVDGKDIRTLKQRSLRAQVGVVLQDPLLFDESVRSNIAYGRPDATFDQIVAAAKAANAHDFILRLPEGYDTRVGERGNRLSTGERQRIAIARALLKDPPILILDEATASLDAETEALVQEALGRLARNRTTFLIAHRLATVVDADRILVLRDGRIAEAGPHGELMQRDGYYAALVEQQTRGLMVGRAA